MIPRLFVVHCLFLALSFFAARYLAQKWKPEGLSAAQSRWILGVLILLSSVFYYVTYMALHNNFSAGATDFLTFAQALWKIIHNQTPFLSFQNTHFLRDHFSPIWYFIAQLFRIWPTVDWLVFLSALFVAGCAGVIYLFAKTILGSEWLGLAMGISYLLNPYYQLGQIAAAHADSFAAIFICLSLYFMVREQWPLFIAAMLMALTGKEDIGLYYGGLGLYLWLGKQKRALGMSVSIIGIAYSLIVLLKIMPMMGPDTLKQAGKYYSQFGASLPEIAANCLKHPWMIFQSVLEKDKIFTLFYLFGQCAFLPLLSGWALVPLGVAILFKSSTNYYAMYMFRDHYALHVLPFLYFSAALGLRQALKQERAWKTKLLNFAADWPKARELFAAVFLILLSLLINLEQGNNPLSRKFKLSAYQVSEHNKKGEMLIQRIPAEASVLAQENIAPHLAFRKEIYAITGWIYYGKAGVEIAEPDYVVFDLKQAKQQNVEDAVLSTSNYFRSHKEYATWIEEDGWVIYKKKKPMGNTDNNPV